MKKALISPAELVEQGVRLVQIADKEFEVAPPLYWVDVPDDATPDTHYFVPDVGFALRTPEVSEPATPPEPGPTPPPPNRATPLEFIDRFTEAEQLAIVSATMAVPQVKLWYDKLLAASFVDFADPRLAAGLDALVQAGLLTAERRAEIIPEVIQISQP